MQIPHFIPRDDLIDQISRWAEIECVQSGLRNFGLPMSMETISREVDGKNMLWGITLSLIRNGETACEIAFRCVCTPRSH